MNVRLGALELDIVARKGGLAVIVEVRSRGPGAYQSALASVSATKRRHLLRAAERLWRETLGADATLHRFRIDVAAVTTEGRKTRVEYVRGAIVGGVVANVDHP
jgi:Holliday junction resolvase-like predicted endonuclease